ncbi:CHRD domain-containing protein [Candidatus Nitrosocosmicus hydrocola]|uniref:CHRD domain-containing protein n=1 Tax=Candidatus Nitrosocosmicus hydrocola TaxID=1826872 RepID=UPI0011E5E797|nr:CHRD domain-containing protein [Candidatus Nitrosocosmicus hydrocola]
MNKRNTKPFFVSSMIALLVLAIFGIGTSAVISQTLAQGNDTNSNNNDDNNGNDDNNDSSTNVDYSTVLSGDQEVPPVNTTAAGIADFSPSDDGDSVEYTITADDIEAATAGHIHFGIEGQNGPVAVTLFEFDSPQDEVSESGTINADDLAGPLEGMQISDLLDAFNDGNAYANIHTEQNPDGEIRGQIISEELQEDTEEQ